MHFSTVLFVIGFACVSAAPVDENQQKLIADVKQAFEPVAVQVRGLLENGEKAIETVGEEAAKAGERLMDSAKNLLNDVQHADRANLPNNIMERAAGIKEELKTDVRSLVEKAIESAQPMKGNLRSLIFSARDAMEGLEKKYLTEDGRDLLKSISGVVGANLHLNVPAQGQ